MFKRALGSLALVAFIALSRSSFATAAPTPVPDVKPDLSAMSIFLGTWKCSSIVRGKTRPDTFTGSYTLDDRWIVSHDVAPPFDQYRERAIANDSYTTWNPIKKMWYTTSIDSFGGYGTSTSPGWKGNTLTTTIVSSSDGSLGHDTLTKVSATETKDVAVGYDPKGKAQPVVTTTCKKQPS